MLRRAFRCRTALGRGRAHRCQWGPCQSRTFFGLGEIMGVIANPAETIKQLHESKDLLKKAKEEMELNKEAKLIPKKKTFAKLPGFHGRKTEQAVLRKVLGSTPQMNVIFGATSVGKTALLREVLATDDFFVIKFDLRISGFADLRSLYIALCEQIETFFGEMENDAMDKMKLTFKHLMLEMTEKEKNLEYKVSVADIANLMESLQSCLLQYWEYDPAEVESAEKKKKKKKELSKKKRNGGERKLRLIDPTIERDEDEDDAVVDADDERVQSEEEKTFKKRPIVFFMDEAHKLPALVDDELSLKVFLDTLLVLTKQDRLCHVILSTSDSFFQHFLRTMNVGHHAHILTIGDCPRSETYAFFMDELVETIPADLRPKVDFDQIYDAFGGKLSHINDYLNAWIHADGKLSPYMSGIFLQAYTLLQFHLTHEGFETFSPLSTASAKAKNEDDSKFSRDDLLYVMRRLVVEPHSLPYFELCRKIGTSHVDAMIKTRVLDLRWTKTVSPEEEWVERKWSEDGIERPIVLPMTRIVRKAMEVVLQEEDQRGIDQKAQTQSAERGGSAGHDSEEREESGGGTVQEALDSLYKRMPDAIWKESPFKRS